MQKNNKMAVMPMPSLVLDMSLPMMFSLLIQSAYNIVDSIFVARLSENALTATSLAYPVQMLMIAVGVGTAVGLNAILSRTLGAGKTDEASQVAATGVLLAVLSALFFTVCGLLFADRLASAFTSVEEIRQQCSDYLFICMVFCLGNLVCMMYQRLMQATGRTLLSMMILGAGAITNIILDPIMIFGLLGCPALGIRGAAIATVVGQWVSMFVGFFLQETFNKEIHIRFRGFQLRKDRVLSIYRVGFPTIVTQALNSMMVTAFNAILQPFSTTAVAFFGVYYKLQNFLFMPMNGLGQASIPIIAFNLGAKNKKRLTEAVKIVYPTAIGIALLGTLLFRLFPARLLGLFSAGEEMLSLGIPALKIISLSFAFASATMISGYIASGLQDGITNMICAFLRQFCPLIPCAYLLASHLGLDRVWYAIWISETCALIFAVLRIRFLLKAKLKNL